MITCGTFATVLKLSRFVGGEAAASRPKPPLVAQLKFLLVDPWPEYWAEDWYATDDVYIDYDDGYYLYNRRYPNVRLAIAVSL